MVPDTWAAGTHPDAMVAELIEELSRSTSGVSFIYNALEMLARRNGLRDAVLVARDSRAGRQVFRLGRADPRTSSAVANPLECSPGLYVDPAPESPLCFAAAAELCQVGLELDLRRHDASHDPLTGLYNRRSFDDLLSQAASQAKRYGWPFSLVLMDLDRFKEINDRYGHATGDDALRSVGFELRGTLRTGDAAARVGGDEFAVLLANAEPGAASALVERLRRGVEASMGMEIGFSAGMSVAPSDSTDPLELMSLADQRLYEAKKG